MSYHLSSEKLTKVLLLQDVGLCMKAISQEVPCAPLTVKRILVTRGLKPNPSVQRKQTKVNEKKVTLLAKQPLTVKEIASVLGIGTQQVRRTMRNLGLSICISCRLKGNRRKKCIRCGKIKTIKDLHGTSKNGQSPHITCCGALTDKERFTLIPGAWERQKENIYKYRRAHPEQNARITREQSLAIRMFVIRSYGNRCNKKKLNLSGECSGNLEICHVDRTKPGWKHRAALGPRSGSQEMNRFIRDVIKNGSKQDKRGQIYRRDSFATLCHKHHQEYDRDEAVARTKKTFKKYWTPERRQARSEAVKKQWLDPVWRETMLAKINEGRQRAQQ